jgi:predicted metalloenzyme YecM
LRNKALEKDKILLSLVERLKSSEAKLSSQVELHRSEVQELEKKLDEVTKNFNVELTKREISDIECLRVHKNVEELCQDKEECYNVATECAKNLKNSFAKVGRFSLEQNFIHGDPDG